MDDVYGTPTLYVCVCVCVCVRARYFSVAITAGFEDIEQEDKSGVSSMNV